jgi:hypothetical protein
LGASEAGQIFNVAFLLYSEICVINFLMSEMDPDFQKIARDEECEAGSRWSFGHGMRRKKFFI